jgi:SNF2 family DNA or RNA helicase
MECYMLLLLTFALLAPGTPIQNDLSEFHAVYDVALPGLLGDLSHFRKQYEYPILRGRDADASSEQVQCLCLMSLHCCSSCDTAHCMNMLSKSPLPSSGVLRRD